MTIKRTGPDYKAAHESRREASTASHDTLVERIEEMHRSAVRAYNDESVQRCIRAGVKDIVHGHLLSEKTVKMMAQNDV